MAPWLHTFILIYAGDIARDSSEDCHKSQCYLMLYPIVRVAAINTIYAAHTSHSLISFLDCNFWIFLCLYLILTIKALQVSIPRNFFSLDFIATTENNFQILWQASNALQIKLRLRWANIRMCCMQRECIFPALFRLKRRRKFSISSAIVSHFNGNDDDDDDDG